MVVAAERSENGRASCADKWLMEENARYFTLKPSAVCLWGERVSSSSTFLGGKGVVMRERERERDVLFSIKLLPDRSLICKTKLLTKLIN
ncbi:unnamed protein product, partial [Vitis vinifera]